MCDNTLNADAIAIDAEPCYVAPIGLLERKILAETPVRVVEKKAGTPGYIDDTHVVAKMGLHITGKEWQYLILISILVVEAEANHPEILKSSGEYKCL